MVIQRIQSLLLLLAVIAVAMFIFMPYGYWDASVKDVAVNQIGELAAKSQPSLLVPAIISAVLSFVAIFCFKKFALQKSLVVISALVNVALLLVVIYMMTRNYVDLNPAISIKPEWGFSWVLIVAAFIAQVSAYRSIASDQRLLRSYDRLR